MTLTTQPFSFEISTPPGWVQVPSGLLDVEQVEEWMNRITKLTNSGVPPAIESMARLVLERLNDETSEFGAYFLDIFDEESNEQPYVVFAVLTLIPGSLNGEECPTVQELAEQVRATYGDTLVTVRDLSTGDGRDCISSSMITKKSFDSGGEKIETEYLDLRIFIPLPEFDQIVSLLLVTPNAELEEEFRELFETIASTLRFEVAPEEDLAPS